MRADLHIHTIASDGCWSPERVVAEVLERGIRLFAVADHDSVASVLPTEALALEAELAFLHGVEISALLDGRIFHILAYGFDINDPDLALLLQDNRGRLLRTNDGVIHRLIAAGYDIDLDDYATYVYDQTRGGWRALNFLIDRGFCTGVRDYFDRLTADLSLPYPPFPHPARVITTIRQAGGVPVLAHPGASLRHAGVTEDSLHPFLELGIGGLECYTCYHDEATTRACLDWCDRHDLLITGGSDCHGGFVGRELGVPVVDTADLRLGELAERISLGSSLGPSKGYL
jgi:predicted metal-dependent phosphoesterase TrpH